MRVEVVMAFGRCPPGRVLVLSGRGRHCLSGHPCS